ncbi:MAG TPA: hypothetical protein VL382_03445 [Terriglobales bacterium]|nr:hypothetical protein [Terriglobales bacterium]
MSTRVPRSSGRAAVIKIDPQRRIVTSTFFGPVTDATLLRHGASIAAEPNFNPTYAEIVDFTNAGVDAISEATLAALSQTKSLYDLGVPHVVVATSQAMIAIASKYQQVARDSRPNLFIVGTLAEAYELLAAQGYGR